MARPRETFWYALKVFYNRVSLVERTFREMRYETFVPRIVEEKMGSGLRYEEKPLIPSLLFVKCPERVLLAYKRTPEGSGMMIYMDLGEKRPGRIDDKEMDMFRAATTLRSVRPPEYLGSDTEALCIGDKVRVTEGLYKGLEGYVKRIKHARKVLVGITGIAVVALSDIHPNFLEKIDQEKHD